MLVSVVRCLFARICLGVGVWVVCFVWLLCSISFWDCLWFCCMNGCLDGFWVVLVVDGVCLVFTPGGLVCLVGLVVFWFVLFCIVVPAILVVLLGRLWCIVGWLVFVVSCGLLVVA